MLSEKPKLNNGQNIFQMMLQILLMICLTPSVFTDDVEEFPIVDGEESYRQFQLSNVSLVITYTGMVVAALMMAGFLYIAVNYSSRRSGYGYNGDYYAEDDYYRNFQHKQGIDQYGEMSCLVKYRNVDYYTILSFLDPTQLLSSLFSQYQKYDQDED